MDSDDEGGKVASPPPHKFEDSSQEAASPSPEKEAEKKVDVKQPRKRKTRSQTELEVEEESDERYQAASAEEEKKVKNENKTKLKIVPHKVSRRKSIAKDESEVTLPVAESPDPKSIRKRVLNIHIYHIEYNICSILC